jgi:hypothetical protein
MVWKVNDIRINNGMIGSAGAGAARQHVGL